MKNQASALGLNPEIRRIRQDLVAMYTFYLLSKTPHLEKSTILPASSANGGN